MSLFKMLQKGSLRDFATATAATVATVHPSVAPSVASVATVNVANLRKHATNDVAHSPENAGDSTTKQGGQVSTSSGTVIDVGTIRPADLSPKLLAASLALDAQIAALGLLPYAKRQSYPTTMTMTDGEFETFTPLLATPVLTLEKQP